MTSSIFLKGEYPALCASFREWLTILGYSPLSIPVLLYHVQEFLYWLQIQGRLEVRELEGTDGLVFMEQMKTHVGKRTHRGHSGSHINKAVQALQLFSRYLRETGKSVIGFTLERMEETREKPVWLEKAEIKALYAVTGDDLLGIRDRAMLAVYYGCGLRLNEGASLTVNDVLADRKLLHVRQGKRAKERYVPIARNSYQQIRLYLEQARPELVQGKTDAFFIGMHKGVKLDKQSLYVRIKHLARRAEIVKEIGTHTLRHSIATHLLQSGMKLERIRDFLGHGDLDSTQIYTHLVNEAL